MGLDVVPLVKALAPPPRGSDEIRMQQWRWNVAYFCLSMGAVLAVHISWACGLLPWVSGFASAADLVSLQQSNRNIEARLVAQDIYEARKEQCKAQAENDTATKPGVLRRLDGLRADYQRITGRDYRMPGCEEI